MIQDLGLQNGAYYRLRLICDVADCHQQYNVDVDKFFVMEIGGNNSRESQLHAFMHARDWATTLTRDGSEKHYCASHAPLMITYHGDGRELRADN